MTKPMTATWIAAFTMLALFVTLSVSANAGETTLNQVEDWCDDGVKYEPVDTPFIVPDPPDGTVWTLLVLKAGTTNETVTDPVSGRGYAHSLHDNSHVILCWETPSNTSTTTSSTTSTTTTSTIPTGSTTSTTITERTTTTTSSSTTTTTEGTSVTTTSPMSSTTTEPSTSTTSVTTSTVPQSTTTQPSTSTTQPKLPNTGVEGDVLPLGLALVGVGVLVLLLSSAVARRSGS